MNADDEVLTLYARIIVLETVLKSLIIPFVARTPDPLQNIEETRKARLSEFEKMTFEFATPQDAAILHGRIKACANLWFADLAFQFEEPAAPGQTPSNPPQGGKSGGGWKFH